MLHIEQEEKDEDRAVGTVSWAVYWQYFRAGANMCVLLFVLLMCVLTQVSYNAGDWWLSVW